MGALEDARLALLVCHLQRDVIEDTQGMGAAFAPEADRRQVTAKSRQLLDEARAVDALRVLIRIAWRPDGSNYLPNLPLMQMSAGTGALIDGQPGAEFVDDVAPTRGDVVLTHHRTNPFVGTDLDTILRKHNIDTVVVCGVTTNVIVQTTIFGATDLGYHAIVVEDACSAATPDTHTAAIETLSLFAEIIGHDDAVTRFSRLSPPERTP